MVLHPKDADGMANSVDPDQDLSDLGLHCLPTRLSKNLGSLWYINYTNLNGCGVLIEASVTRLTVCHHKACQVMPNS